MPAFRPDPAHALDHLPGTIDGPRLADALVWILPDRDALAALKDRGALADRWAVPRGVARRFRRLLVVTWGDDADRPIAKDLAGEPAVLPAGAAPNANDHDALARAAADQLAGISTAIVRAADAASAEVAIAMTARLRAGGVPAALVAGLPTVASRDAAFRDGPASPAAARTARLEAALIDAADAVVTPDAASADLLAWRHAAPRDRFRVVPALAGQTDAAAEPDAPISEPGRRATAELLTFAAPDPAALPERLARVDLVLHAAAKLPKPLRAGLAVRVTHAGPLGKALRAAGAELGIRVIPDEAATPAAFRHQAAACTALVRVPAYEPDARPVLDAMATGAAAVVADAPGLANTVRDGVTGLRVGHDPDDIAAAIARLLESPALRRSLGHAAARSVRRHHGLDNVLRLECAAQLAAIDHAASTTHTPTRGVA